MKRKTLSLGLILLLLACQSNMDKEALKGVGESDRTIIPGERIGLINPNTTSASLKKAYGAENLVDKEISLGEGETMDGAVLFEGTKNELEIVWRDDEEQPGPEFVRFSANGTDWKTAEGITIGTSLEELETINEQPFIFNGFEWDLAGLITDWNEGELSENLIIALAYEQVDSTTFTDLLGPVPLESNDPRLENMDIKVSSIVLTFD